MNIRAEHFQGVERTAFGRVVASLSSLGSDESIVMEAVVPNDGSEPLVTYRHDPQLSLSQARALYRGQHRFFDAVDRMRSSAHHQNAAA